MATAPQLSCTAASLAAGASAVLTLKGTAQQVGATQATVNVNWDGGTQQSSQATVAVAAPAGGLQFAQPVSKSTASGAPVAVALAGSNVFVLTGNVEIYQNAPGASSRVSLTARTEYDTAKKFSWSSTLSYTVSKHVSLVTTFDSDYGVGAGLGFRF